MNFEELFIEGIRPSTRDKFFSRIFGIFSEEIIRIWCANVKSPFIDLGRPTIYDDSDRHYTLDFLLQSPEGEIFITEMKCEIEYRNYKNLTLNSSRLLKNHTKKRAFKLFTELAFEPEKYTVKCKTEKVLISGAALIWGRTTNEGVKATKDEYSINHVLSTEKIISDLLKWEDKNYIEFVDRYQNWSNQLFNGLKKC